MPVTGRRMPGFLKLFCADICMCVCFCVYPLPRLIIQWAPKHSWTSDRPQKQASAKADLSKFGSGILAIIDGAHGIH